MWSAWPQVKMIQNASGVRIMIPKDQVGDLRQITIRGGASDVRVAIGKIKEVCNDDPRIRYARATRTAGGRSCAVP